MAATVTHGVPPAPRLPAFNYNEIVPRLYLGDNVTAANKSELSRLGITDMITAETKILQNHELAPTIRRYLYLNVVDHSKQDLLSHFPSTNQFIEDALKVPTNKVYVHCVAGISRSATLVLAYLMKTRTLDYKEAFDLVVGRRPIIEPNSGFKEQLKLFHKMHYGINLDNMEYRRKVLLSVIFELRYAASQQGVTKLYDNIHSPFNLTNNTSPNWLQKSFTLKSTLASILEQYYNKLNLQQVRMFPHVYDPCLAYKCGKCKTVVFYDPSVIENKPAIQPPPTCYVHDQRHSPSVELEHLALAAECAFIFIEPQPWMSKINQVDHGNLDCYRCKRNIGSFDLSGAGGCSCPIHTPGHMNIYKIFRKKVTR